MEEKNLEMEEMEMDLAPCKVCHEDCAYIETENDWCVYVACPICGTQSAYCQYDGEADYKRAEKKAIEVWNMGKVIAERRGE